MKIKSVIFPVHKVLLIRETSFEVVVRFNAFVKKLLGPQYSAEVRAGITC
jgi:hypothetical protein